MIEEPTASDFLFENEYCFITNEGKLFQKDNDYFDGRLLCEIEKQNIQEVITQYQETFRDLEQRARDTIREVSEDSETTMEGKLQKMTDLIQTIKGTDGIGNFNALLSEIEKNKNDMEKVDEAIPVEEADKKQNEPTEHVVNEDSQPESAEQTQDKKEENPIPPQENQTVSENSPVESDSELTHEEESSQTTDNVGTSESIQQTEVPEISSDSVTEESKQQEVKEETADVTPESKDSESGEAAEEEKEVTEEAPSEEQLDVPEALKEYLEFAQKAESISSSNDWQYASLEFDNLRHKWSEGPDVEEDQSEIYQILNQRFQNALESFNDRKVQHYEEVNRQKLKNVERKRGLLERLEKIIEAKRWHASNEVKGIEKRWENVRLLPAEESEQLEKRFTQLKEVFEQNRVQYLVERKQKEEDNMAGKMLILDKMEALINKLNENVGDWSAIEEEYQELQREWKKVGRVSKEKAVELWQRFKVIRSDYIEKKLQFDEVYRKQIEKNKSKKIALCKEAEALLEEEDLAKAARDINKLHKQWKETGPIPREMAEELWQRFKTASDAFNKKKSENIELLREQEKQNYEAKLELCAKAEAIQNTESWNEGTHLMQQYMDKWKTIGPVPRRKTRKVWKRFKKAMDTFYQRKREFYKELRNDQKDNLLQKREIIKKIRELGDLEDAQEAVKLVKPLQEEFSKVGFVPLKHKNKIYKQYREACDVVYQRSRAERVHISGSGSLGNMDPETRKQIKHKQVLFSRLKRDCEQLQDTIMKYSDTKTFIKPNKKGIKLRDEIQEKIDQAQQEFDKKQEELENIRQEIEDLKNDESAE